MQTNKSVATMKRELTARHLQMMSIGGVIGAGFFFGCRQNHRLGRDSGANCVCHCRRVCVFGHAGNGRAVAVGFKLSFVY